MLACLDNSKTHKHQGIHCLVALETATHPVSSKLSQTSATQDRVNTPRRGLLNRYRSFLFSATTWAKNCRSLS